MELKTYFAQDRAGNLIPSATVTIYLTGTNTLATGLKAVNDAALSNPFTASADGKIQFKAADGIYDMVVSYGTQTGPRITIQCLDQAGQVAAAQQAAADAVAAKDQTQQIIADAGDQSTLVVLAQKGTRKINHAPSDYRAINLETYLDKHPDIREWSSDSANDDTTRFQRAINDGALCVMLPNADMFVGNLNIPTSFKIVGTASQGINKNGSRIIKPSGADYAMHFNGQGMSTRPMGGGIYDTHVVGQLSTDTGDLIKVTSWSYFKFLNSSLQNLAGWGLVLKDTMESKIADFLFRRIGGENSGGILLDDYLGIPNSNVNNLHIECGTWAGMSGAWLKCSDNASVDVLWFDRHKVEWDLTPAGANVNSKYVLDIGQISRAYLDKNTFTHFRQDTTHNKYAGILHMGANCRGIVDFTNNKAYGCDGYFWDIEGGSLYARNNQSNMANASGNVSTRVTSNKRQDIQEPVFITDNMNMSAKPAESSDGFISSHQMAGAINNLFAVDADGIKPTTMVVPASTEARRFSLSKEYLTGNRAIKVTARVKAQSLASGAKLKLNIDGTTDINSVDVPVTGWSLITFVIQPSSIGAGSLRFSNDGTVPLLFDGIKIEALSYIDVSFSWTPGAIAAGASITSPAQTGLSGFDLPGNLISGFSMPSFNGSSAGLQASVNARNATGGWEVTLYNPTTASITPTFTRCKVRVFVS